MLNLLKNFFEKNEDSKVQSNDNLEILCGLMIEAANSDGNIDSDEINKIKKILINIFKEDKEEVELTLNNAIQNSNNSKSLFFYTSKIRVYKMRPKKKTRKTFGSRPKLTRVYINSIRRISTSASVCYA